jgi:hypothetical protein
MFNNPNSKKSMIEVYRKDGNLADMIRAYDCFQVYKSHPEHWTVNSENFNHWISQVWEFSAKGV